MSSPPRDRDAWGDSPEVEDAVSSPRSPTADAAERLVRAASASPRASLDVREGDRPRFRDFFERDDEARPGEGLERGPTNGDAVWTGGAIPPESGARGAASSGGPKHVKMTFATSPVRKKKEALVHPDPDATDVAEEVDALVSAACSRGIGAAAQTLREAMAMASAATDDAHAPAARAMAEALADALAERVLPGLAEAPKLASLASLDAEGADGVDLSAPEATANPRAVLLAARLLDVMPRDDEDPRVEDPRVEDPRVEDPFATRSVPRRGPRERVLVALLVALRARLGNCLEAARAGAFPPLARFLLSAARDAEARRGSRAAQSVARLARSCVARVAAHTVEPADVRSFLAMARAAGDGGARGALVAALAEALERTESLGPAATFQLDGEGSGLLGATGGGDASAGHALAAPPRVTEGASFFRRLVGSAVDFRSAYESKRLAAKKKEWPFRRGFAVCTWAYVESFRASRAAEDAAAATAAMASASASARTGDVRRASPAAAAAAAAAAGGDAQEHMPRLFSFLSTDPDENGGAQGVEAYFHGPYLVVEATGADGRRVAVPFTTPFTTKTWRCVAVEYEPPAEETAATAPFATNDGAERTTRRVRIKDTAAAKRGEVRLYLDGAVAESHRFCLPRVSGPLGFCCFGTNPPAAMAGVQRRRRQCALFASLGPVYVFREAVGARAMGKMAARGGTYVPRYGAIRAPRESLPPSLANASLANASLDAEIAPKLLQVLHPATTPVRDDNRESAGSGGSGKSERPATRIPDLSPLGGGGTRSDRRGSFLGSATTAKRTPIRDAIERASPLGAAALLSLMCAEEDVAAAAALAPTLKALALCLTGDAAAVASAVAALEASAFAALLRRVLPNALRALRDVHGHGIHDVSSVVSASSCDVSELDAAEMAAVDALEVLVAERAPSGSALRTSLCAAFFSSLDAWTGGADDSGPAEGSAVGVGVPALLRVLRVVHAMAHVEGGAALRAAGGAKRVLAAAATRVRFPVCFSPPETTGARGGGGPGGVPGGERGGAFRAPPRATPPLSLRAGVEGAPPGPPRMSHAWKFGVRASFFGEKKRFRAGVLDADDEKKNANGAAPEPSATFVEETLSVVEPPFRVPFFSSPFAARGALLDALVPPVSALLRGGDADPREALADAAAFAGDCEDPRVASRALQAALALVESPGATGATCRRAFVRAGGADACAGMLRALALRYEEPRDPPGRGAFREETKPRDERREMRDVETRLGAGELAASCVCLLSALARGGELAGPGASLVSASFLDAALAERATRHAFRLAPNALLTPEVWSSLVARGGGADFAALGAALESVPRASAATRRRALSDARAFFARAEEEDAEARDARGPGEKEAAQIASAPTALSVALGLPEWPKWLVECVVREAADAADPRLDAAARGEARAHARVGLDALGAQWRRASARAGGWRDVETATRAFRESADAFHESADAATNDVRRSTCDWYARAARAARRCSERALGAHAAYVAAALRRAREIGPKTRDAPREASRVGDSGSRGFRGGSETREPFSFSGTDGKQTGTVEATNATLLAHARFLTRVVADALAEDTTVRSYDRTLAEKAPAEAPRTEPPRTEPPELSSSDPREDPFEEEEEEEETTRLGLLRSARALVDALFASTETVEATVPSRRDELLAAATLVATRNLRAATGKTDSFFFPVNDENPADGLASVSPTETDTRSATPKRSRRGPRTPLVSAACAEAAASADGVGAGGVSAADALGYEFLGSAPSRSDDAAGSRPAESDAEHSRCLATTHRVLAPYLQGGRALSAATRARAPHFAIAALFSELKRIRSSSTRAETRGDATEKTAAFLCAHMLCLVGRWRSAVAEACAEGEVLGNTPASASAAAELLGTAEPTRAMLTRPAAEAVAAALAPPWSDALEASARAAARDAARVPKRRETCDTHRAEFFVDDEDAHFTEASCAARADAERAATDARERAFAAFDARWRRLGAVSGADRGEGDETSEEASDPADPLTPFANLTAKMAHVASRWRELLERASAARAAAENAAREEARRGDEAWRAFAARCAEAGFGAIESFVPS